jgi:mRNA interferase RelE/StbE
MTWELVVAKSAQKELQKLPPKDRDRVKAALLAMRENPFSGDIVRLKGQDAAWRRRVGEYRILYFLFIAADRGNGDPPTHFHNVLKGRGGSDGSREGGRAVRATRRPARRG